MSRPLVIGLGNELRGDDAAGLLVARALREMAAEAVDVEEHSGDVAALAESIARRAEVVIVDAVVAGSPPGTVHELDPRHSTAATRSSSHGLGVADALALADVLEPHHGAAARVRLIGIVGADFTLGSPPSAAVARAAAELAGRLIVRLRESATCA